MHGEEEEVKRLLLLPDGDEPPPPPVVHLEPREAEDGATVRARRRLQAAVGADVLLRMTW